MNCSKVKLHVHGFGLSECNSCNLGVFLSRSCMLTTRHCLGLHVDCNHVLDEGLLRRSYLPYFVVVVVCRMIMHVSKQDEQQQLWVRVKQEIKKQITDVLIRTLFLQSLYWENNYDFLLFSKNIHFLFSHKQVICDIYLIS